MDIFTVRVIFIALAILLLLLLLVSNQIQSNHTILVLSSYY